VIRPAVEAWAERLTRREAVARLSEARVPAAPSLTPHEVLEDEHVRARGMLRRVGGPIPETVVVGNALGLGGAGPHVSAVPRLGQHTRDILSGLLNLTPDEIDQLVVDGVVEDDPFDGRARP
jgi:formyl-CoA transferase